MSALVSQKPAGIPDTLWNRAQVDLRGSQVNPDMHGYIADCLYALSLGRPAPVAPAGLSGQYWNFYHRLTHTDAAAANGPLKLQVWNGSNNDFVSNFSGAANGLPGDSVFIPMFYGISLFTGLTNVGGTQAAGAAIGEGTTIPALATAEQLRQLWLSGRFKLKFGKNDVLDVLGLDRLPPGKGLEIQAEIDNILANTNEAIVANVQSGVPVMGNMWRIQPQIVGPATKVDGLMDWQAAITVTQNVTYTFQHDMIGFLVTRGT